MVGQLGGSDYAIMASRARFEKLVIARKQFWPELAKEKRPGVVWCAGPLLRYWRCPFGGTGGTPLINIYQLKWFHLLANRGPQSRRL